MKQPITLILILQFCCNFLFSQEKKVLFIGNSYTFIEDIPNMVYQIANSSGDLLFVDKQTAGSATLQEHANSVTVTNKINSNNWDFVVLQGQSVEVALTGDYFNNNVAPYAAQLCQTIKNNNTCTQPVFYNTWGREYGMAAGGPTCTTYPWMCSYHGMDDALAQNYRILADSNNALISPVGQVWRYIRDNLIQVNLYDEDESHQSLAGAYASALTFYTIILRKDPSLITYNPGVNYQEASRIRSAVKAVVYDQLSMWKVGEFDPKANFEYHNDGATVSFSNTSENANTFSWDFGDTETSTEENPLHNYSEAGEYTVSLTVTKCGESDTYTTTIDIPTLSLNKEEKPDVKLYPNPVENALYIKEIDLYGVKKMNLYSLVGKKMELHLDRTIGMIDVSRLASGTYFLEIINRNNIKTIHRILKK